MTRDVEAAKAYYEGICGWVFETMPMGEMGDYHLGMRDGKPVVGMMDMTPMDHLKDVPEHWFTYLAVDDVDKAVEQTAAAGGRVMRPAWDAPGVGRIAIVSDPTGAALGLITPAEL